MYGEQFVTYISNTYPDWLVDKFRLPNKFKDGVCSSSS